MITAIKRLFRIADKSLATIERGVDVADKYAQYGEEIADSYLDEARLARAKRANEAKLLAQQPAEPTE